jgi:heme A synthase
LIVLGAVVRSTGSGLACPDWPLCHGRLIPPFQTQVLLEWCHRAVALLVSLGVFALAFWIAVRAPLRRALGGLVLGALGLLAMQIVLGALTVWKLLRFEVVTLHLGNALLFFAVLLVIAERSAQGPVAPAGGARAAGAAVRALFVLAAVVTFGQILLGGLVSTNHAGLACPDWPLCHGQLVPKMSGLIGFQMWHRFGAYGLAALLTGLAWCARREADVRVRAVAVAAPSFVVLQIVLGVFNVWLAVPVWLTAAHLATATFLFALLVVGALRAFERVPARETLS